MSVETKIEEKAENPAGTVSEQGASENPLLKYLKTPYVKGVVEDRLIYSNGFYYVMYQLLQEGKTAEQAYAELGFDIDVLGTNRASCAARRAKEKARNGTLRMDDEAEELTEDSKTAVGASSEDIPPEINRLVGENPYIKSFSNGRFKYYDEIYPAMKELLDQGMSASEAFEQLGIPVSVVGTDRAASVAKRARSEEYAKRTIFNPGGYDGTVSLEKILKGSAGMPLLMLVSHLIARIIYLESLLEEVKKKEVVILGYKTVLKDIEINVNRNHLVDWAQMRYGSLLGIGQAGFLRIFNVVKSTYESYKQHKDEQTKSRREKLELKRRVAAAIREILKKHNGNVPGKRKINKILARDYKLYVTDNYVGMVMGDMGISGTVKRKDAYKGQARHNHPCSAKANILRRDFFKGVGKVILTDITYLYYGNNRKLFYLCVFRDAFTMETLGWAISKKMDQELVNKAYERFKEKLESRKIDPKASTVYIHSDQGSQYLSTTFTKILEDDNFVQSVSRRGNSQDNAPIESFFGSFKAYTLNQLALAPDYETAVAMVEKAIKYFNEELIMESLGWLTPYEFYVYAMTGLYPAGEYFGFKKNQLLPVENLVEWRRAEAAKNAERQRKWYQARKATEATQEQADYQSLIDDVLKRDPKDVIDNDLRIAEKDLKRKEQKLVQATKSRDKAKELRDKIQAAKEWANKADSSIIDELRMRQNWKKYKELSYIEEMDGMYP